MKEVIYNITNSIGEQKVRLTSKSEKLFSQLILLVVEAKSPENITRFPERNSDATRLSSLLYTGATVCAGSAAVSKLIGSLSDNNSDSRRTIENGLIFTAFAASIGGYFISRRAKKTTFSQEMSFDNEQLDIKSIKKDVITKGIEIVKEITSEWNQFMELNQKVIYETIDKSSLDESQKDELSSKIYTYEVIDINLSDLMTKVNSASTPSEVEQRVKDFSVALSSAIETACNNQILKYNSLFKFNL